MIVTAEKMRRMLAEDYARKATAGGDLATLFEFAIEEGWLSGIAAAVELAEERRDAETVNRLRAIVAAQKRPGAG